MTEQIDMHCIEAALNAQLPHRHLTEAEHIIWLDLFTELMGKPGPQEEAFFADLRRRRGLGGNPS